MSKLVSVLTSRKAWAAILAILGVFGVDHVKTLDPDVLAQLVTVITGVYIGSVALEDGLTGLAAGLQALAAWWQGNSDEAA